VGRVRGRIGSSRLFCVTLCIRLHKELVVITSKELAKLAGVSQSTVSRALNDSPLISDDVKRKIKELAKTHRFEMNSQAKSLRTRRTDTIGILFPRFFMNLSTNLYFTHMYDSLQRELSQYDYDLLVVYDAKHKDHLSPLEKVVRRKKVDGIILVKSDLNGEELDVLDRSTIPYVSIFCDDFLPKGNAQYAINTFDGAVLAGEYFSKFTEHVPLFFGSLMDSKDSMNRLHGFQKGLGTSDDIESVVCDMSVPAAYGAVMSNASLFQRKRAVYVYNDMMAFGMLMALKDLRISVPNQVQLISNDDIPLAGWAKPQLSTLRFPTKPLIEIACRRLVREIVSGTLEKENTALSPELILRGTTL